MTHFYIWTLTRNIVFFLNGLKIIPNTIDGIIGIIPSKENGRKTIATRKIYKRLRFFPNLCVSFLQIYKKINIPKRKIAATIMYVVGSKAKTTSMNNNINEPIIIQPNAGIPEVKESVVSYPEDKEFFSDNIRKIKKMGIEVVGGCCGTTPDYIRSIVEKIC